MGISSLITWRTCDGRDGWDPPHDMPDNMGTEALNVSLYEGNLGVKRSGFANVTLTGSGYNNQVEALGRFVAAQDETAAELFMVGGNGGPYQILRVTSGATAVNLTLTDTISTRGQDAVFAALNGKMFIAYDSPMNRMHVYSPTESTSVVRRVGLAEPVAPTVANTGSGSYAATQRWYEVQYRVKSGGTILRASNLSPSVAFTPSGSGTAARITKPASIGEGETHWAIYASASSAAGPFYELTEIVVGTTTYDDSADPATYNTGQPSPLVGSFFPFPSTKAIISDGVRLFGLGVWESAAGDSVAPMAGRVYWTPPLGTSEIDATVGVGDDERIQSTVTQDDWLDLSVNGPGGVDAGLGGPINGVIFAFQSKGIYQLLPTGQATAPFKRLIISQVYGNMRHQAIVNAEDENGAPCVYFLDPNDGPRRVGLGGDVQWLGKDVTDIWKTVDLSASIVTSWGVYDKANKRIIWGIATSGNTGVPNLMIAYHVAMGRPDVNGDVRGGWAKWTGLSANACCAVMFPSTLASPRPLSLCPYIGDVNLVGGTTGLARQDGTTNLDLGSAFQGYIQSKVFTRDVLARRKRETEAYLLAKSQSGVTVTPVAITDWGLATKTLSAISLTPVGSETYVRPRVQDWDLGNLIAVQIRVGDASAVDSTWTLDDFQEVIETEGGS